MPDFRRKHLIYHVGSGYAWAAHRAPGRSLRLRFCLAPFRGSVLWDEVVEAVLPDPITEGASGDPEATGGAGDVAPAFRERCADDSGLLG